MSVNIVLVQIRARAFFHKDLRMMTYPGIRPDTTPAWISNHMLSKMWHETTYPIRNFYGANVEVWEWIYNYTPHIMIDVTTYSCWD